MHPQDDRPAARFFIPSHTNPLMNSYLRSMENEMTPIVLF